LPKRITLDDLFERQPQAGWDGQQWTGLCHAWEVNLRPAPIALVDNPEGQVQSPLLLDLDELNSLILIGAPGSGKTMGLLTILTSLARRHQPDELHFHVLAFGGHQFQSSASNFPHLAGVYGAHDSDQIRRLLATLTKTLEIRRSAFAEVNAADLKSFRRLSSDDNQAAIVIIIDNFSGFLENIGEEQETWRRLLREGGSYGLYFLLASDRMPPNHLADLIKGRMALTLADTTWYSVILGGRPDLRSHDPLPGRGFLSGKQPCTLQLALPYDGQPEHILAQIRGLACQMKLAWSGPTPEPIRILPDRIDLSQLLPDDNLTSNASVGLQATIGLEAEMLEPLSFDLNRYGSTFLVSGPPESGKTTSLIGLVLSVARQHPPEAVNLVLVAANRGQAHLWKSLSSLPHCQALLRTEIEFVQWLETMEAQNHDLQASLKPTLMIMDDQPMWANRVSSQTVNRLEAVVRRGEVLGLTLAASLPVSGLNLMDGVARALKTGRIGLWLKPSEVSEAAAVGLRLPRSAAVVHFPMGRGFVYQPAKHWLVQVATPFHEEDEDAKAQTQQLENWVRDTRDRWGEDVDSPREFLPANASEQRRATT
jgi:S-DNA-T family DNA segregation ATPase FtsK/SpoIIIE